MRGRAASARRVVRGGSYLNDADRTRAAYRENRNPRNEHENQGFRVMLPPAAAGPEPAAEPGELRPRAGPSPAAVFGPPARSRPFR